MANPPGQHARLTEGAFRREAVSARGLLLNTLFATAVEQVLAPAAIFQVPLDILFQSAFERLTRLTARVWFNLLRIARLCQRRRAGTR